MVEEEVACSESRVQVEAQKVEELAASGENRREAVRV